MKVEEFFANLGMGNTFSYIIACSNTVKEKDLFIASVIKEILPHWREIFYQCIKDNYICNSALSPCNRKIIEQQLHARIMALPSSELYKLAEEGKEVLIESLLGG